MNKVVLIKAKHIPKQETAEEGMAGLQSKFKKTLTQVLTKINQNVDRRTDGRPGRRMDRRT